MIPDKFEKCPSCGEHFFKKCKCPLNDRYCKNGHHWYRCPMHPDKIIIGLANHDVSTYECRCTPKVYTK